MDYPAYSTVSNQPNIFVVLLICSLLHVLKCQPCILTTFVSFRYLYHFKNISSIFSGVQTNLITC